MTSQQTAVQIPGARVAPDAFAKPDKRSTAAMPGTPHPLGATPGERFGKVGTNFALASEVADGVTFTALPLTFIAGGMPAVMNRSEARWCAISLRNEVKSMVVAVVFTAGSQWGMYQETVGGGNGAGTAAPWRTPPRGCPPYSNRRLSLA